ncbi:hypothetical protein MUK42_33061 [Musa troglodytarum]|uniref:Uncharacterized protein n=1 Tax=Musa troglodytarum TaxID=320322 RepID=A0A9E7F9W4_9LILI|nr:hypothetical protein MUK42_33061 [Musa troglodytarum]
MFNSVTRSVTEANSESFPAPRRVGIHRVATQLATIQSVFAAASWVESLDNRSPNLGERTGESFMGSLYG